VWFVDNVGISKQQHSCLQHTILEDLARLTSKVRSGAFISAAGATQVCPAAERVDYWTTP